MLLLMWFSAVVVSLFPPGAVVAVVLLARWMKRRRIVPAIAARLAYGLAAAGALVIVAGTVSAVMIVVRGPAGLGESSEASQRARFLAEGISEALNCWAFGGMIAIAAAVVLGAWAALARRAKK